MSLRMSRDQRVTESKVEISKRLRRNATPAERILWEALRGRSLDGKKFRRQQIVIGFIVDFYCEQSRLAVEVDGSSHDGDEAKARDAERDEALRAIGVKVLHIDNEEVLGDLPSALRKISQVL